MRAEKPRAGASSATVSGRRRLSGSDAVPSPATRLETIKSRMIISTAVMTHDAATNTIRLTKGSDTVVFPMGQMTNDFQVSDFKFQISDFKFRHSSFGF